MKSFKLRIMAQVLPFLLVAPVLAPAQTPPSRSEATAAMKAGQHDTRAQYTKQQIDQLIAPIALYPDQLLVQVAGVQHSAFGFAFIEYPRQVQLSTCHCSHFCFVVTSHK